MRRPGPDSSRSLTNLLDNAVKYSPDGGEIRAGGRGRTATAVLLGRDRGIGLPPGAAETIFEPFGADPTPRTLGVPGFGLGLFICRRIVERHGGRIWAESAGEGAGTTLAVWLPCSPTADADQPAEP